MHSIILKDQWNKINEKSFWRRLQGKDLNFSLEANWRLLFVYEPKSLFSHPWVMSSEDFKDLILVFSEFPQIACWMHYLQWRSFFKYIAFGEKKLKMTVSGRRSLNEMGAVRQRILVKIASYARIVCRSSNCRIQAQKLSLQKYWFLKSLIVIHTFSSLPSLGVHLSGNGEYQVLLRGFSRTACEDLFSHTASLLQKEAVAITA